MSDLKLMDTRFTTVMASIRLASTQGIIDLGADDFEFLASDQLWIATDRSRVRRCVEACVYGGLDMVGIPRLQAPAEFVAGAIINFVHPVNFMFACAVLEGAEFTDNVINGVEAPLSSAQLFSLVVRCAGHRDEVLNSTWTKYCRTGIAPKGAK